MRFHITITDNKTGEVIRDLDTCAIIGAVDVDERTGVMVLTECNNLELAATAAGALEAVDKATSDMPDFIKEAIKEASTKGF